MTEGMAPSNRWRIINWLMLLACILIAAAAGAGLGAVAMEVYDREPPVDINSITPADSVTYKGGTLQLRVDARVIKDCPSQTSRWLWTWVKFNKETLQDWKPFQTPPSVNVPTTKQPSYLISLSLPQGVFNGDWYYVQHTIYECPGLIGLLFPTQTTVASTAISIGDRPQPPPRGYIPTKAPPRQQNPLYREPSVKRYVPSTGSANPLP